MLTDNKGRLVHAGGGAVSMLGVENETVVNTLRVLGVKVTASVDVSSLILVESIGGSRPPGKPEEGREGDGDENDDGGSEQAQGVPLPKKGASA